MKSTLLIILLVYVGMGLYLYLNQKNLLYYPSSYITKNYTNMTMENGGESINVIVANEGNKNAIIYFGGNAEAMAITAEDISRRFPGFTLYLMEYRGYGRSSGESSEQGQYSDALKLYDTVRQRHEEISIGGRSLGAGIAIYVAAHKEVKNLALITPYDSIVNVGQKQFPIYPVDLLLKDKYNVIPYVKDINSKTLVIIAEQDKVIPKVNTQNLINAFDTQELEVVVIKDRGHNDLSLDDKYYKTLQDFVNKD